ncbi:putative transmembrane protein [Phytophthora cinnamomi]|uniref:putative transmembrane protein n=1 Tax=Phytophthora cinnamomi TaxID=4785 RepID=UPI00355A72AC|nr:putative transmembrane protein [Phytophthora cinnamomi]
MADAAAPQPRRTLSRETRARETESSFADFLSDGSNSSDDEDEDDAASRALLRMQQQADDCAYSDAPFELAESTSSFRLTLPRPRDLDAQDAGPRKLVAQGRRPPAEAEAEAEPEAAASVDDVLELVSKVERVVSDHLGLSAVSLDAAVAAASDAPRRKTSVRESESAFADFLSDGSNSSDDDEDEDDADTRALLRMQQQADDRAYLDTSLKMERAPALAGADGRDEASSRNSSSFRLTLAKPGVFDARADDGLSGPRKLVEAAITRESVVTGSEFDKSDEDDADERPSFNDENSFTGASFTEADAEAEAEAKRASDQHESLASRPPSFDEDYGDSFFDERRPSFSDEPSFTGGDTSFTAADNSFVFRPSLPDDEEEAPSTAPVAVEAAPSSSSLVDTSFVYRPSVPSNDSNVPDAEQEQPASTNSFVDTSFVYRPTLPDNESGTQDAETAKSSIPTTEDTSFVYRPTLDNGTQNQAHAAADNSFVYRPTLPDDDGVCDHTHTVGTDITTTEDRSFVYRPTLPGDDSQSGLHGISANSNADVVLEENSKVLSGDEFGYDEEEDEPSFLSPSTSSFFRSSDAVDFGFGGIDSSFRLHDADAAVIAAQDESFNNVLTDSCASSAPPTADTKTEADTAAALVATPSVETAKTKLPPTAVDIASAMPIAESIESSQATGKSVDHDHDSKPNGYPITGIPIPSLSRHSSVSSTVSGHDGYTRQRRLTSGGSWSVDFRESKHAFDEEVGPLADHPVSPQAAALKSEQQGNRLSSTFEERASASSSFSQADFFVDDVQQTFLSESSLSLDSRPSADDSFANVAILGDNVGDQNERRSSDIIPQDNSGIQSIVISKTADAFDHSYSNLLAVSVGVDQSFSTLVDHDGLEPDGEYGSASASATGTSLVSSLASSAISQSSTASDELPFVSFSAATRLSTAKPATKQQEKVEQRTLAAAAATRQNLIKASEKVPLLPSTSDAKGTKPSEPLSAPSPAKTLGAKKFSSAALLAAIKTRDVRADTRSEETEAGDVAPGALAPLAPPLKINIGPRGRGSLSSSVLSAKSGAQSSPVSGSPLNMSFITRSSVASSTGTADRLDFTGVYRGSVNSLEASQNNGVPSKAAQDQAELEAKQRLRGDATKTSKSQLLAVKLERSKSDSRAMHLAAQRKVEDFFRRKQDDGIDEREVHRLTTRLTRSRTTVMECMDDAQAGSRAFALDGNKGTKIIDLKNLRNGGKRPGWHLESDAPMTPQQEREACRQGAMGMTSRTTSTGTTATRSIPSDVIPVPHNYGLSPQAADKHPHLEEKERPRELKANASADASGFGAGRRADNLSFTPTLPRLSANESPSLSASPFVFSHAFGAAGRSPGKSPVGFGATSGFLWKTGSGFKGVKRSVAEDSLDASHVTFSQRPTLAERVQSLSASLASTLRRFLPARNARQHSGEITSPQSHCTAPAALPRGYDQDGFYETPFKVPELNRPLLQRRKKAMMESNGTWARQWLILAVCAMLGLSLGVILVSAVAFNGNVFNLSADDVRGLQDSNGELVLATAVRWMLLPGQLFVRVWSAVTTPLLFCYVVTALADLVGCADKTTLVLSFRSIGYALLLAMLAAAEGIVAMWMTHKFGWFRGNSNTAIPEAMALSAAVGVSPLPSGAVGLLCMNDGEYLQRASNGVFACSNASLTLPLYDEVNTNSTVVTGSGPAVFALQEVSNVFATPPSVPYYPTSFGSSGNITTSLLSALTLDNLALQFTDVASDEMASMCGLITFALVLGYFCGKRILRLRRDAQAAMFESARRNGDPGQPRHYIVSILMELQLALEWLVRPMERYLAPVGFFSLTLGNMVLHHREWRSFTSPMTSLIVGVLIVIILHAVLVLPVLLRVFSSRQVPVLTTARAFVPTFLFAFSTDNLVLTAPVTMQCYARVLTVTRSAAQLVTAVATVLTRNARALYLPLLLLWLMETSTSQELHLTTSDYFSMGLLSLLSSFLGGSTHVTLALARTVWSLAVSKQLPSAGSMLPPTMPLLVVCDVVLSRMASVVTVADHLVLSHLTAQYWTETVVHGPSTNSDGGIGRRNSHEEYVPSPSPLDDSQAPRPSSSAMLSSVYL